MNTVAWHKPETIEHTLTYKSKCGRFVIERRRWCAPSTSTSYELTWREGPGCALVTLGESGGKGFKNAECDTLAEAKQLATGIAGGE